jgi:cytochrome c-type biogenesis protein
VIRTIVVVIIKIMIILLLSGCFKNWGSAPDFTLQTIYGDRFVLSEHLGKVIVIDFMATWCYPCKLQMKELDYLYQEKGNEIVIVSVDVEYRESADDIKSTFGEYVDKWTFVLDNPKENVARKYGVQAIPKIVIIDKKGNIYNSFSGLTSKEVLLEVINRLIS